MITLEDVLARIQGSALVLGVDTVPKGHIRIETVFQYPDGDSIELFLLKDVRLTLSDLGQTETWLSYLGLSGECTVLSMELESLDALLAGIEKLGREAVRIPNERVP